MKTSSGSDNIRVSNSIGRVSRTPWLVGLILLGGIGLLAGVGLWIWRRPVQPSVPAPGSPTSALPPSPVRPPTETILVDDFETGKTQGLFGERKNRLDAFQGTWARRPSYTVITKVVDTRPGSVGDALRIEFSKTGGWCGWYTLLNGIDVSRLNCLTFWVKGERGGERFDIGMADEKMQELEIDAIYAGPIMAFLPQGVTTAWQPVKIPLLGLRTDMDMTRMGSLVFWFRYEGKGAILIDDVAFAYDEEVERIQKENAPRASADPAAPRALWVWKYDPVLKLDVREELFAFAGQTAIRRVYLYLGESPVSQMSADYLGQLAGFLRQAHGRGIEIHALQGNPLWALKAYHPKVLAWIGGFLEFNRGRPPEERMDGVHMDIEPYLTQEWETGDRERLKAEFLALMTQCRALIDKESPLTLRQAQGEREGKAVRPEPVEGRTDAVTRPWAVGPTAGKPFVMGLAIPIFYDREPEMEEKLLKLVDYAALMDYYDAARDLIEHGRSHVELASRLGVAMVIGVETQDLVQMNQGKRRNTFVEEGWEDMERELDQVKQAFSGQPGFDGLAIHCYYSYRVLQRGRNVPTRERTGKVPPIAARPPAQPVVVDGDLADWAGAEWVTVDRKDQVVYGAGAWGWSQDLSYKAAVQWEPKALLLAVDVTDDLHVQEKRGADMWEGDHFELWVDVDLHGDYAEAVNSSDDFQIGLSPGDFKDLAPEVHVWVPSVSPESVKEVELAAQPKPDGHGYTLEVRLPASFLFQNVPGRVSVEPKEAKGPGGVSREEWVKCREVLQVRELKAGFRLGLMLDGSDCDAAHQPQKCLLSTSTERQWGDPTTFNVLELNS